MPKATARTLMHLIRRHITGAGMIEYAMIIGLVAVFSVAALNSTGLSVRTAFCLATDGIRVHFMDQEPVCDSERTIADGGASGDTGTDTPTDGADSGGGEGSAGGLPVEEPPVEEGFVFDTTGLFFPNVILDEGTVALQTLTTDFAGVYSTQVEYRVRRLEGSSTLDTPSTIGAAVSNAGALRTLAGVSNTDSWSGWSKVDPNTTALLGLQMTPPSSLTATLAAYYEVTIQPEGRPSLAESFTFSVTRAGGDVVFEPDFEATNITFPVATTGGQTITFPFKGAFNTDLRYQVRRNGASDILNNTYERIANARGSLRYGDRNSGLFQGNSTSLSSVIRPSDVSRLGLLLELPTNVFLEATAQYDLMLWAVDTPENVHTTTFTVERPAAPVVFEPHIAVEDVVVPVGTTGAHTVLFDLSGAMNSDVLYTVRRVDATNMGANTYGVRAQANGNTAYAGTLTGGNGATPATTITNTNLTTTRKLGIEVTLPTNVFQQATGSYELVLASAQTPEDTRAFAFTVTRPAETIVFEPQIAVQDVVLPIGSSGPQDVLFDITGTMNSDITYTVRRVDATNMANVTYGRRKAANTSIDYAGTLPGGNGSTPATTLSTTVLSTIRQIGVNISPSANAFLEVTGSYELLVASVEAPQDVRTFAFTITRPAQTVVFEPNIAVQDIVLPVGATGVQEVLFDVTGTMNSDITYTVRRIDATNMTDTTYGRRKDANTTVSATSTMFGGNGSTTAATITATQVATMRQLGVAVVPSTNTFQEATGSYELLVASTQTPQDVRTFAFTVTRPAATMVFTPTLAVEDITLATAASGEQSISFPLTFAQPTTATNLIFDVRRISGTNMGTVTTPTFTRDAGTVGALTALTNEARSQAWTLPTTTRALGVRILTPTDAFLEASGTYEIRVAPSELPNDVRVFTFTVTRPAQALVFNPTFNPQDTTVAAGTTGYHTVLFDLGGTINTDLRYTVRRVSQTGVSGWTYGRRESATGTVDNVGMVLDNQPVTTVITQGSARKLGVNVLFPTNAFDVATATYELSLASVNTPTDMRTTTFTVTRTPQTLQFNPSVAVSNITVPEGATGNQEFLFDLTGEMNTHINYSIRRVSTTNLGDATLRFQNSAGNVTGSNSTNGTTASTTTLLAPQGNPKIGLRVAMPNDPFLAATATFELRLASVQTPTDVRTFTFTVTRTPRSLVFEPQPAVQNVVLAESTTGRTDVLFDLGGTMNSDFVYRVRRTGGTVTGSTAGRVQLSTGIVTTTDDTTATNSLTFPSTYASTARKVGIRLDLPTNIYTPVTGSYQILIHSPQNPTDVRTFSFTVTRAPRLAVFNATLNVANITIPAGTTTNHEFLFDVGGTSNADISYTVRRVSATNASSWTWPVRAQGGTATLMGGFINNDTITHTVPSGVQQLGMRVQMPTHAASLTTAMTITYQVTIAHSGDPSQSRSYTFTVTRPAM